MSDRRNCIVCGKPLSKERVKTGAKSHKVCIRKVLQRGSPPKLLRTNNE